MSHLDTMARRLNGDVASRARLQIACPGPGHSPRDRSLSVFVDPNSPDGFMVHCHAPGDDWREARDHVKARLGITDYSQARRDHSRTSRRREVVEPDDTDRTARALAIWQEADKLDGSAGMTWLFRRGVNLGALPRDLHGALRWHPACPWEGGRHGCMVGLFTDAATGEPRAIHRTAFTPAGDKVGRKALGPIAGCVIRLWPDEDVLDGLVIGEGIETTLAAATCIEHRGTLLQPAWAAGFAGNMAKLPVLGGVEALTLLVDNDASGAGQRAAEECSARWTAAGCEVHRLVPRQVGADFNDIVEAPHG